MAAKPGFKRGYVRSEVRCTTYTRLAHSQRKRENRSKKRASASDIKLRLPLRQIETGYYRDQCRHLQWGRRLVEQ